MLVNLNGSKEQFLKDIGNLRKKVRSDWLEREEEKIKVRDDFIVIVTIDTKCRIKNTNWIEHCTKWNIPRGQYSHLLDGRFYESSICVSMNVSMHKIDTPHSYEKQDKSFMYCFLLL